MRELGEHLGQQHGQLVVVAGQDEAQPGAAVVHRVVEAGALGVVRELGELVGELLREDPREHGGGRRVVRRRREQVDVHVRLRPAEGGVGLVPQPQPLVVAQQPREHGRRRRRRRVVGGGIVGGGGSSVAREAKLGGDEGVGLRQREGDVDLGRRAAPAASSSALGGSHAKAVPYHSSRQSAFAVWRSETWTTDARSGVRRARRREIAGASNARKRYGAQSTSAGG